MSAMGKQIDKTTIEFERLLPGPIERVWAYLTDSKKRSEWLAAGDMELKAGGRAEFLFDHRKITLASDKPPKKYDQYAGETRFEGKILEARPPTLLRFEWPEASGEISEVKFELASRGDKVRLLLTHSRLVKRDDLLSTSAGWHAHLDILEAKLAGKTPPPFWSSHTRLEGDYAKRLPAA
ncbi:MAG: SRPBCC family protein [Parvularculaceae bacterium]